MRKRIFLLFSSIVLLAFLSSCATAPPGPPPSGKVWHKVEGKWVLVPPPPKDGPYIWRNGKWVLSPAPPPPGKRWVPGHHGPRGRWIPGHWK